MGGIDRPNLKISGRTHRRSEVSDRIRQRSPPLLLLRCSPTDTLPESPPVPIRSQYPQGALGGHSAAVPPHPRRHGNQNHPSKCRCSGIGGCGRPLPVALRMRRARCCENPWEVSQLHVH